MLPTSLSTIKAERSYSVKYTCDTMRPPGSFFSVAFYRTEKGDSLRDSGPIVMMRRVCSEAWAVLEEAVTGYFLRYISLSGRAMLLP